MPLQSNLEKKFDDLKTYLDDKMRTLVKIRAQGGNSIIFSYPPDEEKEYLTELNNRYPNACFINIADLFVEYIDEYGIDAFSEFYKQHQYDPEIVFVSDNDDVEDFYKLIMKNIEEASDQEYIFLTRTGALYGTGISNLKLLENKIINKLKKPIVVMYPSTSDSNMPSNIKLKFLGFAPASTYRSFIIDS